MKERMSSSQSRLKLLDRNILDGAVLMCSDRRSSASGLPEDHIYGLLAQGAVARMAS
jgi:hypothetical protein